MTVAVFYDPAHPGIYIGGIARAFPPQSLVTLQNPDGSIEIWLANNSGRVAGPFQYTVYTDQAGDTFSSSTAAKAYLDGQFSKTPIWGLITVEAVAQANGEQTIAFDKPEATIFALYINGLRQSINSGYTFGPSGLFLPAGLSVLAGELIQADLFQSGG